MRTHVEADEAMTCRAKHQGAHHDAGEVDGGAGVEDEEHGGGGEGPEQGDEPRGHQHAGDVQVGEVGGPGWRLVLAHGGDDGNVLGRVCGVQQTQASPCATSTYLSCALRCNTDYQIPGTVVASDLDPKQNSVIPVVQGPCKQGGVLVQDRLHETRHCGCTGDKAEDSSQGKCVTCPAKGRGADDIEDDQQKDATHDSHAHSQHQGLGCIVCFGWQHILQQRTGAFRLSCVFAVAKSMSVKSFQVQMGRHRKAGCLGVEGRGHTLM